jgi:subtilisin-like proprotein convertase family protein
MTQKRRRRIHRAPDRHLLEELEVRSLLSASPFSAAPVQTLLARQLAALQAALRARNAHPVIPAPKQPKGPVARPIAVPVKPHFSPSATPGGITPSQMRHAYGIDQVMFGNIVGDGTGQTIAIIDAYHYPTAAADLHAFSVAFGLPDAPSLRVVAQDGSNNYPPTDPAGPTGITNQSSWELEEALDLQWAHAIAPGANLILVEALDASFSNLVQAAVVWAKSQPGVTAVSMSFGATEFSGENTLNSVFTTPANHSGVTFLASTGDTGSPGGFPAFSPNVVSVGGTSLTLAGGNYVSESGWSGSGGGVSQFLAKPSYQSALPYTGRSTPDVAMDADPNTGVPVYDSYDFGVTTPWITLGGTSLACPMFAGIISIVNQGRAQAGLASLDGATQTLPKLYALPASDFHDIVTGSNAAGSDAGPGYDLVTGRGSPIANLLIPDLIGVGSISGIVYEDRNANATNDAGDTPMQGVTVYIDANNNGLRDVGGTRTLAATNVPLAIPDNNVNGASSTLTVSGAGTTLTDLNITFSINHTFDHDLTAYLISPDGVSLKLFSGIGGSSDNFTNTTLDDSAATIIGDNGTAAPFNGTFQAMAGSLLSIFNGHPLDGTWTFKVVDNATRDTGTIVAWSLIATTASETAVLTDAQGRYTFNNLSFGAYTIRQVVPTGYIQTQPSPGVPPAPPPGYAVTVNGSVLNQNFGNFPTTFSTAVAGDGFSLNLDATGTRLQIFAGALTPPLGALPTYSIALNQLPSLTFTFSGVDELLTVDFSNGSPIPAGNITLNASAATNPGLAIYGQSSDQQVSLLDTQLGPAGGPVLAWQNLGHLDLHNITANYYGTGANLPLTNIDDGAVLYWYGPQT